MRNKTLPDPTWVTQASNLSPPQPARRLKKLTRHGDSRSDYYYWLNERDTAPVLDHLEKENDYYAHATQALRPLEETLFQEMKKRVPESDSTPPYFYEGYYYASKVLSGLDYPLFVRQSGTLRAREQVLVDPNQIKYSHQFGATANASADAYFNLTGIELTHGQDRAIFGIDRVGRRHYNLYSVNLKNNVVTPFPFLYTSGEAVFALDDDHFYFVERDPQTLREFAVYRSRLSDPKEKELVFKEKDEGFYVSISESRSKEFLLIHTSNQITSEAHTLPLDMAALKKAPKPKLFLKRKRGHEYHLEHYDSAYWIVTNGKQPNFDLMWTTQKRPEPKYWKPVVLGSAKKMVESFVIFEQFIVVQEKENALRQLRVIPRAAFSRQFIISQDDPAYDIGFDQNWDAHSSKFRYEYSSLRQPRTVVEYDLLANTKEILKTQKVPAPFSPDDYVSERIWIPSRDKKTQIPVSLVYAKNLDRSKPQPLLLYGYGSYGIGMDAEFNPQRLSILDRGFIYAIAHIRGGDEMGRAWYEAGKLKNKKNTFADFVDVAQFFVTNKWSAPDRLFALGGSAGGLLMGATLNMAPELFRGVIAQVPFVDVLTTMMDETLPLTVTEYDEWGNPNRKADYLTMKAYSPYDNVKKLAYPHTLILSGYHDSQVQYFEPTKWALKLREYTTAKNLILLHTDLSAGHSGKTGRYERLKDVARMYAFCLALSPLRPEKSLR